MKIFEKKTIEITVEEKQSITAVDTSEEIFKKIDEQEKKGFVTAKFGTNWKKHAKENYDFDTVIDIAHVNGRKVILLEIAIEKLLRER